MNDQPLVSVVIATYNMGQYLPEAIDSVLAQRWENLEVIVVDDGSTDDTPEQMKRFEGNGRVRYLPTENRGQPKAKNRGLKEANGDFIAFCDADDIWHPEKLSVQMPLFEVQNTGVVYSEVSYIDQNGKTIDKPQPYERYSGEVTNHLIIKNFVPFGTAVIRRECLEKNGYFDEDLPMGIDWDLWLRYSMDWRFQYTEEKTYIYRIWPGQMSKNYRGRYDNAFRILKKFITNNPTAVPIKLQARAWSDMYVSRGMSVAHGEKTFSEPFKDILMGLRHDFFYMFAWKALAKLLLRRI
ncbi:MULTISPECIES: glycosyltransferase family 2 protein [Gammaproteobacteria]|jgi:glycosyltransferase involved in cell wall biosynthesis|uniref:glycosyltransferase family 2 protein n=1 Tax=Gammaproteobacteria TaxID=1236 RepID=UPI0022B08B6A|nr:MULTISPECIES: glycosyltransferase [Gammaproteobacteria]MCZ4284978.1 glycosyltransferase [Marinobacter salarius]MDC9603225.1 glycosyltransferase [Pseudoalteromonas sp. GABNS16G]